MELPLNTTSVDANVDVRRRQRFEWSFWNTSRTDGPTLAISHMNTDRWHLDILRNMTSLDASVQPQIDPVIRKKNWKLIKTISVICQSIDKLLVHSGRRPCSHSCIVLLFVSVTVDMEVKGQVERIRNSSVIWRDIDKRIDVIGCANEDTCRDRDLDFKAVVQNP